MRTSRLAVTALLFSSSLGFSAFTSINSTNTLFVVPFQQFLDFDGVTGLSNGGPANGDGDLIQIGILSADVGLDPLNPATWGAPSWATFLPLTGAGSNNAAVDTALLTSMGDGNPPLDGFYSLGVTLNDAVHPDVPQNRTRLVIRYYNGPTVEDSTHYTTVAANNANWLSKPPTDQPGAAASLDLDNHRADLVWEGGAPWQTNLLNPDFIPEPSTALLGLLGMTFFLRRRR